MSRNLMDLLTELKRETDAFHINPAHELPRCRKCHRLTKPPTELVNTGSGFYYDSETLCSFCKADANARKCETCGQPLYAVATSEVTMGEFAKRVCVAEHCPTRFEERD